MRLTCLLLMMLLVAGCNRMRVRVDNPLVGPPPPRDPARVERLAQLETSVDNRGVASLDESSPPEALDRANVVLASRSETHSPPEGLSDLLTRLAARVNGKPIFVGDIVEPYRAQLERARSSLSEEEFNYLVNELVKRDLDTLIEQTLLVDSLMSQLKEEQRKKVEEQIDAMFEERMLSMQQELGVPSLASLELQLQQAGTSLSSLRRRFGDTQIAGQALAMKMGDPPVVSRSELLEAYYASRQEFTEPTQVRWQQIWVSRRGTERQQAAARERIEQAEQALREGRSFDEVAREFSQGALASNGGHWDWTRPESLENKEVAGLLVSLPIGSPSGVITDAHAYQILRVTDRRLQSTRTFEEVQLELRERLLAEKQQAAAQAVIDELLRSGIVERYID